MVRLSIMTNLTNTELADKVREAYDNILYYGWRQRLTTRIGEEIKGLCIGSALAMAFDEKQNNIWNYGAFTLSKKNNKETCLGNSLCDNGKALTPYLRDAIDEISGHTIQRQIHSWNDSGSTTKDMVLDVLLNTEKALREDARP